jgi:hypothetical protein
MDSLALDWIAILLGVVILLLSFAISTTVALAVLAMLPPTFFQDPDSRIVGASANPALHLARRVGKNLIGYLAIAIGLLLALPGVPGPGLPIALLGIMLADFPGKRRLVRKLLRAPKVLSGVNALRKRLGKSPFLERISQGNT